MGLLYRTIHKIHHLFANTLPIDSGKKKPHASSLQPCVPQASPKQRIFCSGTESPFEWLFDETHVNVRGVPWALQLFQFLFVNGHLLGHDCLSVI